MPSMGGVVWPYVFPEHVADERDRGGVAVALRLQNGPGTRPELLPRRLPGSSSGRRCDLPFSHLVPKERRGPWQTRAKVIAASGSVHLRVGPDDDASQDIRINYGEGVKH